MGISVADLEVDVDANTDDATAKLTKFRTELAAAGGDGNKFGDSIASGADRGAQGLGRAGSAADDAGGRFSGLLSRLNPFSSAFENVAGAAGDMASGVDAGRNSLDNTGRSSDDLGGRFSNLLGKINPIVSGFGSFSRSAKDVGSSSSDAKDGMDKLGTSSDQLGGRFKSLLGNINPLAGGGTGGFDRLKKSADDASGGPGGSGGGLGLLIKTAIAVAPALAPITTVLLGLTAGLVGIGVAAGLGFGALALAAAPTIKAANAVATAQQNYNNAVAAFGPHSTQATTAQKALTLAISNTSPAIASAGEQMSNFKTQLQNWQQSYQPQILPLLSQGLNLASTGLLQLNPLVLGGAAGMKGLLSSFQTFASSPATTSAFNAIGKEVNTVFTALGPIITGLLTGLLNFTNAAAPLINIVLGLLQQVSAAFAGLNFDKLLGPLTANFEKLAPIVGRFLQSVLELVDGLLKAIGPIGTGLFQVISAAVGALTPVIDTLGKVIAAIAPVIASVATALAQGLGSVIQALIPVLLSLLPVVSQLVGALGGALIAAIHAIAPALVGIASVLSAVFKGIGQGIGPLSSAFASFLSAITPLTFIFVPMSKALQQMSPLFVALGKAVGQLAGPVAQILGIVLSFAATLGEHMVPAIATLLAAFVKIAPSIIQVAIVFANLLTQLSPLVPVIATVAGILAQGLASALAAILTALQPLIPAITVMVAGFIALQKIQDFAPLAKLGSIFDTIRLSGMVAKDMLSDFVGKIGNVASSASDLAGGALSKLRDGFGFIADKGGSALSFVKNIGSSFVTMAGQAIQATGAVLKNAAAWVVENAALAAEKVAAVLSTVATAALDVVLDANPLVLIAVAIVAVVAGLILLFQHCAAVRDIVKQVGDFFVSAFHAIESVVKDVIDWITSHWKLLLAILLAPILPVVAAFLLFHNQILNVFKDIVSGIEKFFGGIAGFFTSLWSTVEQTITKFLSDALGFFEKFPSDVASVFGDFFTVAWNAITKVLLWLTTNLWTPAIDFFKKLPSDVASAIGDFFGTAFHVLTTVIDWIETNVGTPLRSWFSQLPGRLASALGDIVSTVFSGLESAAGWIYNNVIQPIVSTFSQLPGMIGSAINSGLGAIGDAGKAVINAIIGGIDDAINFFNNHIPSVFGVKIAPSIPDIPKLATGTGRGTFGPGIALVGEQGPELVNFGAPAQVVPTGETASILSQANRVVGGTYVTNIYTQSVDQTDLIAAFRRMELMGGVPS